MIYTAILRKEISNKIFTSKTVFPSATKKKFMTMKSGIIEGAMSAMIQPRASLHAGYL